MKQSLIPISVLVFLYVAFMTACIREVPVSQEPEGRLVTLSASIDTEDESKASVTDGGQFSWSAGDQISVWTSDGKFTKFTLSSGAGTSSAVFSATLGGGVSVLGPAVFPHRDGHSYNAGTQVLTFSQGTADDWNAGVTKSHMAAKLDGSGNLSFKHLDGMLRLIFYNIPREAARVRVLAAEHSINGNFTVNMAADVPQISAPSGSNSRLDMKLNSNNTGEVGQGFVLNFPLPVGTYTNMTVSLLDADQNVIAGYSRTIPSVSITRKKLLLMPELSFDPVQLADSENGELRDNFMKSDTGSPYPNTEGTSLTVVDNPLESAVNASAQVIRLDATGQTSPQFQGGYFPMTTKNADYSSGFRNSTRAFTMKVLYSSADDATLYYPHVWCKDGKVARMATTEATLPDRVNGVAFDGTAASWAQLIKTEDWNVLQWTVDNTATWRVDVTPFLDLDGNNVSSGSRVVYLDDFRFLKYSDPVDPDPHETQEPVTVEYKRSVEDVLWSSAQAYTVDCIDGFDPRVPDPSANAYGGWTARNFGGTGYFRTQKVGSRWWLVDPDGNPYLSCGVAVFTPGNSTRQTSNISTNYGGKNSNWAKAEIPFLFDKGFNSVGAWSEHSLIKTYLTEAERIPYSIILSPMSSYIGELRNSTDPTLVAAFEDNGWEDYPYDFAMVFDSRFDDHIATEVAKAAPYVNEKHLIGYFLDNEVPWKDYALEWCLSKWPADHINRTTAQSWLNQRKKHDGATISEATEEDKHAFIAYCYGVYLQKVTTALRAVDSNHLILGSRFNQWDHELSNPAIFEVAGQYLDVISINFYRQWQPDVATMQDWLDWGGVPFLISEFYTKGDTATLDADSYLTNVSGSGWIMKTQYQRGLFYQNFVNQLLKSKGCVGWHWFSYMDNDPTKTASENANKGIVKWNCGRYSDCISEMEEINSCLFNLATFYN